MLIYRSLTIKEQKEKSLKKIPWSLNEIPLRIPLFFEVEKKYLKNSRFSMFFQGVRHPDYFYRSKNYRRFFFYSKHKYQIKFSRLDERNVETNEEFHHRNMHI